MGARGQHRTGFYVATLYALERYYALQAASGLGPKQWRPAPRQRPDQFLAWTRDVLRALHQPADEPHARHLQRLRDHGLPRVAQWLELVCGDTTPAPEGAEQHPQARKMARVLAADFDPLWREALERAVPEAVADPALLLGGLPPGFEVLERLVSKLGQVPSSDLTALQFYGLAVGRLPAAPPAWQPGLVALAGLGAEDLERLASLSDAQLGRLRCLSDEALALLALRRRLGCDEHRWQALGAVVQDMRPEEVDLVAAQLKVRRQRLRLPGAHRAEAQRAAYVLAFWTLPGSELVAFKQRLSARVWQQADLDPELRRLLDEGRISPALLSRLRTWTSEEQAAARCLHAEHPLPLLALLEDQAFVAEQVSERSDAVLNLGELFPQSVAWLEQRLGPLFDALALHSADDLAHQARAAAASLECQLTPGGVSLDAPAARKGA